MVASMQGKVRDTYDHGPAVIIVTSDRQSAFDRLLASIPFKVTALPVAHLQVLFPRANT